MASPSARTGSELRRLAGVAAAAALAAGLALPAQAAHPMLGEDTGTQGTGRFELEMGGARARDGDLRASEFGVQLSGGVADTVDLIVRPVWLEYRGAGEAGASARGAGDTALDVKWRFLDGDVFSFGTRVGVLIPTGNADEGLGQRKASFHGVLMGQAKADEWTFIGNAGYVQNPAEGERSSLWYLTASALWQPDERFKLSAETAAYTLPDPARSAWQAVARVGVIATLTPWLDIDAGYQFRLNREGPVQVVLAGATIRW